MKKISKIIISIVIMMLMVLMVNGNTAYAKTKVKSKTSTGVTAAVKKAWGKTSVKEYVDDDLGVHFFIPSKYTVSLEKPQNWETTGVSVYLSGNGINHEYLFTTGAESREVNSNSDAGEAVIKEITDLASQNMQYVLYFPNVYEDNGISSAMSAFLNKYEGKIVASAYVPKGTKPPYYSFSVADDKAVTTANDYYEENGTPAWVMKTSGGQLNFVIGQKTGFVTTEPAILPAGTYSIMNTFGYGNVTIYGVNGAAVASYRCDMTMNNNNDKVTLTKGQIISLDADDGQCMAVSFNPQ